MSKLHVRIDEFRYFQITRRKEKFVTWLAHKVPNWLKYRVFIDVTAYATTRPALANRETPAIPALEVMKVWADDNLKRRQR